MVEPLFRRGILRSLPRRLLSAAVLAGTLATPANAVEPAPMPNPAPEAVVEVAPITTVAEAVRWALAHNPDLATARKQHGIAASGVVIARTYPFNPVTTTYVWYDNGPDKAGVNNHVFNEHIVKLDLEVHGQGKHRRAAAAAALSRTEWDIVAQEAALAIRVVRACDALAYRRQKLILLGEAAQLQQQTVEQLGRLVQQGKANRAEQVLARADLAESRTQRAPANTQYVTAWYDLRRLLGFVDEPLGEIYDGLDVTPIASGTELIPTALARRPDVRALDLAVQEADAKLRFEISNRYGNPSIGPAFEYNETSAYFIGLSANFPLPVLNTHRGEIQLRRAEREKACAALLAAETHVRQDIQAALARVEDAQETLRIFREKTLPALDEARQSIDRLLTQGEPGVDFSRGTDIRRRLLKARDAYLDAQYELCQARADLAAAVGDPGIAIAGAAPVTEVKEK